MHTDNYAFKAYIKDIWLELPDYKFNHRPDNDDPDDTRYIGRQAIQEKFGDYLKYGKETGAYLITGYRGVGKTSFVSKVIKKYQHDSWEEKGKIVRKVTISFGQKDIKELDILRQIVKAIKDNIFTELIPDIRNKDRKAIKIFKKVFKSKMPRKSGEFLKNNVFTIRFLPLLSTILFILMYIPSSIGIFNSRADDLNDYLSAGLIALIISYLVLTVTNLLYSFFNSRSQIYDRLDDLYERCLSQKTEEFGIQGAEKFPIGILNKKSKIFPIANPKEVENEIIEILQEISKRDLNRNFIFVFDEIDKVDNASVKEDYYEEMESFEHKNHDEQIYGNRERKKAVLTILANLKYLITTANARFVFIAGREMFDAALADIADRQSAISSIFHQVLNVDSFLKDKMRHEEGVMGDVDAERTTGINNLIEEYLEKILLKNSEYLHENREGEDVYNRNDPFLKRYYKSLHFIGGANINEEARLKIIYSLQHFIIYVAYRSSGSPKKLIKIIEELIRSKQDDGRMLKLDNGSYADDKNIVIFQKKPTDGEPHSFFLVLNYVNQYKCGFISYLYRPFLISYGKTLSAYSDHLLVSTPFLLDHIIKFHPFAFSLQNLELVPELMSESKPPELRSFIEGLINLLNLNHIRNIEMGLFDYKFLDKTFHEINYLCKIFEEESAAFNFTLDETFNVKQQIRTKIKELRSIYKSFRTDQSKETLHSISFLNNLLGDANYFDQNYDDAIVAYSDAIEPISQKDIVDWSTESFVTYVNYKLKIGLVYEKMKSLDIALAIYYELIIKCVLFAKQNEDDKLPSTVGNIERVDVLKIIIQPFLAELFLLEKKNSEGITNDNLINSFKNFNAVAKYFNLPYFNNYKLALSNIFSSIGSLLYVRNYNSEIDTISIDILYQSHLSDSIREFQKLLRNSDIRADIKSNLNDNDASLRDYNASAPTYAFYKQSLIELLSRTDFKNNLTETIPLIDLLIICEEIITVLYIKSKKHPKSGLGNTLGYTAYPKSFLRSIGNCLSKIGDCLFSGISSRNIIFPPKEGPFFYRKKPVLWCSFHQNGFEMLRDYNQQHDDALVLQLVMCIYYWSGQFYYRSERYLSCSFQYRKIMEVAKDSLKSDVLINYKWVMNELLKEILRFVSYNSNSTDRYQILKYKNYFLENEFVHPSGLAKYNYLNLSTSPEAKEIILLYLSFLHHADGKYPEGTDAFVSPYSTISTQFIRVRELHLQEQINSDKVKEVPLFKKLFSIAGDESKKPGIWSSFYKEHYSRFYNNEFHNHKVVLVELFRESSKKYHIKWESNDQSALSELIQIIVNSIFCELEIITIFNRYGISYLMSYSELADHHRRLAKWYKCYEFFRFGHEYLAHDRNEEFEFFKAEKYNISKLLKRILKGDLNVSANANNESQHAMQNYNRAKMLHSSGATYKSHIRNMYYLEDDYNDNLYHFCISLERYKINSGYVNSKMDMLWDDLKDSQLNDISSFVNTVNVNDVLN